MRTTAYGCVEVLHDGRDLKAWRIVKDAEEIDPGWLELDREDLLYVVEGQLKLEFADDDPIVLESGESYAIPPGTRFRGYRYPREAGRCVFLAVSSADVRELRR